MSALAGDEPHYLVLAQSFLTDQDLKVANNYARGDHLAYYSGDLHPHLIGGDDIRTKRYSQHAPGVSLLIAPVYAIGGHWAVVVLVAALTAVGTGFVWQTAYLLTRDAAAAWFGWAAITLVSPVGLFGALIYPDPLAGAIIAVCVWALANSALSSRLACAIGVLVAILPWLHTRLAIPAAFLTAIVALRTWRHPRVLAALLAPIATGVAGWLIYFRALFGSFDPRTPYGGSAPIDARFIVNGLSGVLFDQEFGLIANAPIFVVALAGLWTLWRRAPRLTIEFALIAVPYAAAASGFVMWWGGYCPPARFLVPVNFPLGIAAALAWSASSHAGRVVALVLLVASIGIASVLAFVNEGRLAYNNADGSAAWIGWLDAGDHGVTRFLPSFFRDAAPPEAIRWTLIASGLGWTTGLGAIFAICARIGRRP